MSKSCKQKKLNIKKSLSPLLERQGQVRAAKSDILVELTKCLLNAHHILNEMRTFCLPILHEMWTFCPNSQHHQGDRHQLSTYMHHFRGAIKAGVPKEKMPTFWLQCGPKHQKSPQCRPNGSFADLYGSPGLSVIGGQGSKTKPQRSLYIPHLSLL